MLNDIWSMVDKKTKNTKQTHHSEKDDKKNSELNSKKSHISDSFLDELKGAFSNFNKIPETHRLQLYGDQKFLEQFWEYFKIEHPNLLDKIDKEDLPVYIHEIEKKWFSIENIKENAGKLNEEFKNEDTEKHVIEKSLSELKIFCKDAINNLPGDVFDTFADASWFDHNTWEISAGGEIQTIDDLPLLWKKFIEKEGITIWKTSAEHAERILTPNYNPTERVMVTVAVTKIAKELTGSLKTAFQKTFSLPITVFSSYQDLLTFRDALQDFLATHASEIDQWLAKKIDSVIVTNGDIYNELSKSWRKIDTTKGFSEWEQYFRRIFNKLATRQLFEEVEKTQETIDHYITVMGSTFKEFPPYLDDILHIYPFNAKTISTIDASFLDDLEYLDAQILTYNEHYAAASEEEKTELRKKIKTLKQQKEHRRWQAYIAFLRSKDAALADVFAQLVTSTFDFSVLSSDQQQVLVDVLVKNKLEDSIKHKIPELLDVKEEMITQFIHDLFDLKKMDITIPTRHGTIPLTFLKKEFLASTRKQLPALSDLESEIKNLPLNFLTQLTESNAAFFEDSPIFDSIYTDFTAKNGKFRCNDAYKVRIKKNGKVVEWYLSAYSPLEENNTKDYTGKELYLYSAPITAPNQERTLVTRPHDEGKSWIPVVIKDGEQAMCDMEILDRQINLNGDAFWALMFGYVLGQQSLNTTLSPEKEKELAQKLGDLDVYKEKEKEQEEIVTETTTPEHHKEKSEQEKFMDDRQHIKWYGFPEEQYKENHGFVVWTKLFSPFADSEVPPIDKGKAWLEMEITHINTSKWTFTVKFRGKELGLGKSEGTTKELPISASSLVMISKIFGDKMYKMPNTSKRSFDQQKQILTDWSLVSSSDLDKYFWSVTFDGSKFSSTLWNYKDKEITHFGLYEPKAVDESVDEESGKLILYKVSTNANGTLRVSGDSMAGNYAKNFPARDMDYASFMLFVKEKWLQAKCKEQIQSISTQAAANGEETPTTVRWFSLNNVFSFFKNGISKIQDGIKKYDDERAEDLTDLLTSKGKLWGNIWWVLSPFGRIASSFETMGMEYFQERDNRIRKKVEKRSKFYEDFDYSKIYTMYIQPMLDWTIKIVPHYKMAALLLVHLKKGKWPYAKNPTSTAKGSRIGALLGKDHQARYLAIREKRIRDLEQNAHIYGGPWADQIKNELVELEMRYIVHVMDGRHMWMGDDVKYYFQDKYSKKFCDELEWAYTWFFKQSTVEEWFSKNQEVNFEFARVEYFRQLADRPQQAIPFLKVMATKAINDTQWQVFETAVMAWILSGVFLNMTYSSTQSYIQKICRTRGFIPGIFAKDVKQQHKMQRLLDIFSGGDFSKKTKYSPNDYSYRENKWPGKFIKDFISRNDAPSKDWSSMRTKLSKFLDLTWKDANNNHTLLDFHSHPDTTPSDKALLEEFIGKSNEKNESLDSDVQQNTSSLTWSVLTKSQSVVEKMIKFDNWGFAWKDGDEIQNMQAFSEQMEKSIPKWKLTSQEQTKFFVNKFFNRFGERWFSWNKMTEFLKRLKWCKNNPWSDDMEDVLYYSVVWEIVNSLAWNNANPPEELKWALWAWKDFFKNNINTILEPEVITSCFGGAQYKADYDKSEAILSPRESSWYLLDREESNMYMYWLPKEEKNQATTKKRDLGNERKYLNHSLYILADSLSRKCSWFSNRFRKDVVKPPVSTSANATWARIKNSKEVMENVRKILEGKQLDENADEDSPPMQQYNSFEDNW